MARGLCSCLGQVAGGGTPRNHFFADTIFRDLSRLRNHFKKQSLVVFFCAPEALSFPFPLVVASECSLPLPSGITPRCTAGARDLHLSRAVPPHHPSPADAPPPFADVQLPHAAAPPPAQPRHPPAPPRHPLPGRCATVRKRCHSNESQNS